MLLKVLHQPVEIAEFESTNSADCSAKVLKLSLCLVNAALVPVRIFPLFA
jgi:hypothetical protein